MAKIYFSKEITPEKIFELYKYVGKELKGNVAVKLHSGEAGNQNFLKPELFKPVIDAVNGTVVECNTTYDGERNTTEKHLKLFEKHDEVPAGLATGVAAPLPDAGRDDAARAQTVLDAHKTLVEADGKNAEVFRDVIAFAEEDVDRLKK